MIWPRLAAYRFRWPDASFITAYPDADAPIATVWDTYRRSVLPMAMQAAGWEALHASATDPKVRMYLTAHTSAVGPRFAITTSGSDGEQRVDATTQLTAGRWAHVAVTKAGNVGTIYVDGVAAGCPEPRREQVLVQHGQGLVLQAPEVPLVGRDRRMPADSRLTEWRRS